MTSTHKVEVVRIDAIEPHPNAATLGIVKVYGYTCCVRISDWKPGDLAAYIQPDSVVPATERFAFLGEHRRIKVKRLRGLYSQGLLVPAPAGAQLGEDVANLLGVTHYDPPELVTGLAEDAVAPSGYWPVYDVESWYRYGNLLELGERVVITEKIHGCNGRFLCLDDQMHVGSRTRWKNVQGQNIWATCLRQQAWIETWCRSNPGLALYGEVYGQVQDLKYGVGKGELRCAVFDIFDQANERWLSQFDERWAGLRCVPELYHGPYDPAVAQQLAEGSSTLADHVREGCVIRLVVERLVPELGRLQLKIVGNGYLVRE